MRVTNIRNNLKKNLDYLISNSGKIIKTGIIGTALSILPINYARAQKTDITNAKTDDIEVVQAYYTIRPGHSYKFNFKRTDAYKGTTAVVLPMSSTENFIEEFKERILTEDSTTDDAVNGNTIRLMEESIHPRINYPEWQGHNIEQSIYLSKALNNQSANDPLWNLTTEETNGFFKLRKKGPNYTQSWIGVVVHYDGVEPIVNGKRTYSSIKEIPIILFIDDVIDSTAKMHPGKNPKEAKKEKESRSRIRPYIAVGAENIFDINEKDLNIKNAFKVISAEEGKLGLDFGIINLGAIGGYGTPSISETIENKNIQGNGGTVENYTHNYKIIEYGGEIGFDLGRKLNINFNYKQNKVDNTTSGTVTQDVNAGYDIHGKPIDPHSITYDLGTTKTPDNFKTWGVGLEYKFGDHLSTSADINFHNKEPYSASLCIKYIIGKKNHAK